MMKKRKPNEEKNKVPKEKGEEFEENHVTSDACSEMRVSIKTARQFQLHQQRQTALRRDSDRGDTRINEREDHCFDL